MSEPAVVKITKWRDVDGNVYSVEKSARNGHHVVIRTNAGGNRKAASRFVPMSGNAGYMQEVLDAEAALLGWKKVNG